MSVTVTIFSSSEQGTKKEKFEITMDSEEKAYSFAINASTVGYWRQKSANEVEFIPGHKVLKILVNGTGVTKGYTDTDVTNT